MRACDEPLPPGGYYSVVLWYSLLIRTTMMIRTDVGCVTGKLVAVETQCYFILFFFRYREVVVVRVSDAMIHYYR